MKKPRYKRILFNISGEILTGEKDYGIDPVVIGQIGQEIKEVVSLGVEVAIVIGGGQYLSRRGGKLKGNGPGNGRLHGDAGNRLERSRPPGCP